MGLSPPLARYVLCVLASLGCSPGAPPAPLSLVPSDYLRTFTEVRGCRMTVDHAASGSAAVSHIRVLINPEASEPYRMSSAALAPGTLVIKEESDDSGCGHVTAWTLMRKEPGFDSSHGDWHYQRVRASDRAVLEDGRVARCSNRSCHGAPACTLRDWMCTDP